MPTDESDVPDRGSGRQPSAGSATAHVAEALTSRSLSSEAVGSDIGGSQLQPRTHHLLPHGDGSVSAVSGCERGLSRGSFICHDTRRVTNQELGRARSLLSTDATSELEDGG